MSRHWLLLALFAALSACLPVSGSSAAPGAAAACSLPGSWVASTAETNRYMQALNPTTTAITVTSGALSATFDRGTFTFGSLGLKLKGRKGAISIKEELDIEAVAPYTAAAGRISLGRGTYKLRYISVVITTSSGTTVPVRLPSTSTATPRGAAAYTCTPSTLRLRVPLGGGDRGVTLTLQRDRG